MSNPPSLSGEPLVRVLRGALVESVHEIAACAVGADGTILFSAGSIDVPVYLRSAAKPFIAAAVVAAGAAERFGLENREIAMVAASHTGQPFHVAAVRSILKKIGMTEEALLCGAHAPYNAAAAAELAREGIAPSAVHNNCSGKHAGILALCAVLNADTATYLQPGNPAQREILALCARLCGQRVEDLPVAVDGCGIPVYATPLRNAALSFARFAALEDLSGSDAAALRAVRTAMMEHPEYVSGTDEFDTRLMQAACGRIACKSGAEGVHGVAVLECGGLALKVIDGSARGRSPAVLSILRRLNWLTGHELQELAEFEHPALRNRAGTEIGEVRAYV